MSGHNKFSKIKRLKAKNDGQKAALFTKMAKMLQLEAKKAGGNVTSSGLKSAIEKAKTAGMPNDNIDRAIKKATEVDTNKMEEMTYEAYGPGGVALIIEALASNKNKAAQEIKFILSKNGGVLATSGAASWAFDKKGKEWEAKTMAGVSKEDADQVQGLIEALEDNEDVQDVYTNAEFIVDGEEC